MKITDTIAAIATAAGHSGIGVIRVSGEDALLIVDQVFKSYKGKSLSDVESHTAHFGYIMDEDTEIDQVLVLVMRAPNSYTGENTVEIDCHGGMLVLKRVLDTVIKAGARSAEPGEFTKRAFLNGKMDLSQAEAVMDLINAKNEMARNSSIMHLKGDIADEIKALREKILYHIAYIESALDDPEHISLDGYSIKVLEAVDSVSGKIQKLADTFDNGRIMKEGISTVILGKPNAGKSSLLNLLLGEDRAIVTDVEGTTRDTLEEYINIQGIGLNIVDTAGIRSSEDVVEQIGVSKAKEMAEKADLVLFVVDGASELDDNDRHIFELISGKKAIVLINKTDIDQVVNKEEIKELTDAKLIDFSAKTGEGMDKLISVISKMFFDGEVTYNDQIYITNARHKEALDDALKSLSKVRDSIENKMPEDFYSIDLMDAYTSLGLIIGESVEDDLVNEIFSKFCMGK